MAGSAQRGTRGHGRSSRGASRRPLVAAGSAAGSGSAIAPRTASGPTLRQAALTPQATYRTLLQRGLAPDEAANLTAFLSGIPVSEAHWKLNEVNRLLFIRELQRSGRFGRSDGATH